MSDTEFPIYPTWVTKQKTGEINWFGSGVEDYNVINFAQYDSKYKVIAQGWMDLANPGAGFDSDSASAVKKVELQDGQYYD